MLSQSEEALQKKGERLLAQILASHAALAEQVSLVKCHSMVGGGSLPTQLMPSYAIRIKSDRMSTSQFEKKMRITEPHIVGRVEDDRYYLDVRTLFDDELEPVADKIVQILS